MLQVLKSSQKNHLQARQLARTRGIAALAWEFAPVTAANAKSFWNPNRPIGLVCGTLRTAEAAENRLRTTWCCVRLAGVI
jgi:hypothetical protein